MPTRSRVSRREYPLPWRSAGGEPLEGMDVLEEERSELGVLLWQSCRDVALWGEAPAPRAGLFAAAAPERRARMLCAARVDAEIQGPLAVFAALPGREGGAVDVPRLGHACRRVARWAEERGKLGTAAEFLRAATAAAPGDPSLAVQIGRLSRMRARYEQADLWFRAGIVLARERRDWQSCAEAYAGLGNLYVQKGNLPQARRFHAKCLRAARRHGLREMEGAAWHNLAVVSAESGDLRQAEEHAAHAFAAYPAASPPLPRLAHDLALIWTLGGHFACARVVLEALLACFGAAADRLDVLGDLARAAGGAGEAASFDRAWDAAWATLAGERVEPCAARALLGLAHGAASLGRWECARRAAGRALEVAEERREGKVMAEAEALLERARHGSPAREREVPPPPPPSSTRLAERVAQTLRAGPGSDGGGE